MDILKEIQNYSRGIIINLKWYHWYDGSSYELKILPLLGIR